MRSLEYQVRKSVHPPSQLAYIKNSTDETNVYIIVAAVSSSREVSSIPGWKKIVYHFSLTVYGYMCKFAEIHVCW